MRTALGELFWDIGEPVRVFKGLKNDGGEDLLAESLMVWSKSDDLTIVDSGRKSAKGSIYSSMEVQDEAYIATGYHMVSKAGKIRATIHRYNGATRNLSCEHHVQQQVCHLPIKSFQVVRIGWKACVLKAWILSFSRYLIVLLWSPQANTASFLWHCRSLPSIGPQ